MFRTVVFESGTFASKADRLRGREVLLALLAYGGLVLWLTWPLAESLGASLSLSQKACRFDSQLLGWTLAHQSDALLFSPSMLLQGGAFYPAPNTILLGEAAFGALPIFLPVFALSGNPTLALNLIFLLGATATIASVHLVVRRLTSRHAAGVVAAVTLLSSRWLLWQWAPCAPNYAMMFYLPWIFLLLAVGVSSRGSMFLLAFLMAMQGLVTVYLAVATFLVVGAVCLLRAFSPNRRAEAFRLLGAMSLAALPLILVFSSYLATRMENPDLATQSVWRGVMQLSRLPWGPLDQRMPTGIALSAAGLLGLGLLAAAGGRGRAGARSAVEHSGVRQAVFWIVVGVLVSFSPIARLESGVIRLPHFWLSQWLGVYEVVREPHRLAVIALVGLSIGSGLAVSALMRRFGAGAALGWLVVALWVGVVGYETHAGLGPDRYARPKVPLPRYPLLQPPAPDDVLARLLAEGDGPVLELPVPLNRRGLLDPVSQVNAMYRSIYHRRPVVNGYNGYWPAGFAERMTDAQALPDLPALRRLQKATDLTTIVVHLFKLNGPPRKKWVDASKMPQEFGMRLDQRLSGVLIFSVLPDL